MTVRSTTRPMDGGAHGSFDSTAANARTSKLDRRLWIISMRFTEQEMHMLRAAITAEHPTVTEVIRARVFVRPLEKAR